MNPIDRAISEEQSLAVSVAAFLDGIRETPVSLIAKAIEGGSDRSGDSAVIFAGDAWQGAIETLRSGDEDLLPVIEILAAAAELGARWAVETLGGAVPAAWEPSAAAKKPILLEPEIAELGRNWARYHADQLIRGLDARSRANVRRLVGNASRRLARNPRGLVVEQLAEELQPWLGLTPSQTARLKTWEREARKAGTWTAAGRDERIAAALAKRARFVAGAEIATAFNEGTIRAARLAEKNGTLPQRGPIPLAAVKQAETMRDDAVRPLHTEVANMGAVPLAEPFPIFNADRPPWPGEHG